MSWPTWGSSWPQRLRSTIGLTPAFAYVSSNSWGPTERNSPGAFLLHAASGAYAVGPAKTFKDLGIDHIGVITQDSPTGLDFLDNIIGPVLEHNGIEMERIVVDSAAPDWTAAIAAAQTSGVEGLMGHLDEFGCIGMVGSAAASGFDKPIFAGSCTVYINLLGEAALGTYTQGDQWIPSIQQFAPPEIAERLEAFREHMTAAGYANMIDGFAVAPYSAWRELEFILETIEGPITPESIIAALWQRRRDTRLVRSQPALRPSAMASGVLALHVGDHGLADPRT